MTTRPMFPSRGSFKKVIFQIVGSREILSTGTMIDYLEQTPRVTCAPMVRGLRLTLAAAAFFNSNIQTLAVK